MAAAPVHSKIGGIQMKAAPGLLLLLSTALTTPAFAQDAPGGQPTTQDPYDRTLVSDALRAALGVPDQAAQERRRAEFEARARAAGAR